jgi:AmmeMemoRadiSam system protein B/AmmeMemoRadiSam system protein A
MMKKKKGPETKAHQRSLPGKKSGTRPGRDKLFYIAIALLLILILIFAYIKMFHMGPGKGEPLQPAKPDYIRKTHVAGTFYPAQEGTLGIMVDTFLNGAGDRQLGNIKALVVPHAGYIYSGQVAGHGFKQLEPKKDRIKKVYIIGNNHARGAVFSGISIPNYTHYSTPLGKVKVSSIADQLLAQQPFTTDEKAHTAHILEVELPFLQKVLSTEFEIIPMIVGFADQDTINDAAKAINDQLDSESMIIISSDLSHYHPYNDALKLDNACINQIENQSFAGTDRCEACGKEAILILLRISEMNGWKAKILDYKNSGDTAGTKDAVVGYSSIAFYTDQEQLIPEVVNKQEQQALLKLARDTVEGYVKTKKQPNIDSLKLTDTMKETRGCFVTLNKNGNLRGCIGHIIPQKPLYECVIENAINAATADTRFTPVTEQELNDIHIDISVLTLPEELSYTSPQDLLSQLHPNIDGVVLRSGFRSSTYLPQVWGQLPDKNQFMESLCRKQGSATDCWKSAKVFTYQAQVFAEEQ